MTKPKLRLLHLSTAIFFFFGATLAYSVHDYDYHTVSYDHVRVPAPHTRTIKFDGGVWFYAKTVSFTVQALDCHRDSVFDVYVNGSHKMGYMIPRCLDNEDRTYTVNVGQTAKAITFRARSGEVVVKNVVVYGRPHRDWDECIHRHPCDHEHPLPPVPSSVPPGSIMNPPTNVVTVYARSIVDLTVSLRPLTPYEEYGDYVLPIKLHAGKVIPLSRARGVFSDEFEEAVELLIAQIDNAEAYFEEAATVDRQYELIVALREMRHKLAREFF